MNNIKPNKNVILQYFKDRPTLRVKPKQLRSMMNVPQRDYPDLRDDVKEMARDGELQRFTGNLYGLPQGNDKLTGLLDIHPRGYGLVKLSDSEKIFISADDLHGAAQDDTVQIQIVRETPGKKREGIIKKIIKRGRSEFLCIYHPVRDHHLGIAVNQAMKQEIIIQNYDDYKLADGEYAIIKITEWPAVHQRPFGEIVRRVGSKDVPEFDAVMVANQFGIPDRFPEEVLRESENSSLQIDLTGREDFRNTTIFTIDPIDARDFDDAVSIESLEHGNLELGVHIADVSHYVKNHSPLDREAIKRGTSVYFTRHVIPMLPEKLSNEICSLKPDEDRLTFSVMMTLTPDGEVVHYRITPSIIRSAKRFTYEEVQEILDNQTGIHLDKLQLMRVLAERLYQKRYVAGSIDLDIPEPIYTLDADDVPVSIAAKERLWSHRIVEEFMLLANKTVAEYIQTKKPPLPFLYRVHEKPKEEDVKAFFQLLKSFGIPFPMSAKDITPRTFQQAIEQVSDTEIERFIEKVALRSMMKARYSTETLGHFGLAFQYYSHFTSPIRRYPDLMIHRLLKCYLQNAKECTDLDALDRIAKISSETELRAMDAEREYHKIKKIKFMKQRIGEEYNGIISGVVPFGFYVELTDNLVEGLVHVKTLPSDFWEHIPEKYMLHGRRNDMRFQMGDTIRVKVAKVSLDEGFIDFEWLPDEDDIQPGKKRKRKNKGDTK